MTNPCTSSKWYKNLQDIMSATGGRAQCVRKEKIPLDTLKVQTLLITLCTIGSSQVGGLAGSIVNTRYSGICHQQV